MAVKHFQVRPHSDTNKTVDPGALKAWSVLMEAMGQRDVVALIKLAMRDQIGFYLLFSDGFMEQIAPLNAVRLPREDPRANVDPVELELALNLIDAKLSSMVPVLEDDSVERVMDYARRKHSGGASQPMVVPLENRGTDLIEQLQASLEAEQAAKAGGS
jgi:non-homologous end joining protein Ku